MHNRKRSSAASASSPCALLFALSCASTLVGCSEPPAVQLALPAQLRLTEMAPAQQALLRATIDAPGLLAPTALAFDDDFRHVAGSFVVAVDGERSIDVSLRVFGRLSDRSTEVLLGIATKTVTFRPREATSIVLSADDWRVVGVAVFDDNANGASNVDDLVAGFDPAAPGVVLDVSPTDVQFPSDVRPGDFRRQLVIVHNTTALPQNLTAEVIGAQGASVVVVDATGAPASGAPRKAGPFVLQPFGEQLLAVTFAPTNRFLARGALALTAEQPDSRVRTTRTVAVLGNTDGFPQPVDPAYDVGVLDGAVVGFDGPVVPFPPELLFAGQPLGPGPVDVELPGAAVVDIEPLRYPESTVAGLPASAVFLVQIPPRARLSVELSGLSDNADLGLVLLDDADQPSRIEDEVLESKRPGTSPEVLQFRNAAAVARRALIVIGRVDGREVPGVPAPDDVVPFSLLAQLNIGPELADDEPVSPLRGAFAGRTRVTITGVSFAPGAVVRFGSRQARLDQTTVSADGTTISTETPAAVDGDVGVPLVVVVQNPDGAAATHPPAFVYDAPAPLVRLIDPPSANEGGGTPVTIHGAYFSGDHGGPRVRFGDVAADAITFVSSTELAVVASPHAPGLVNVTVANVDAAGVETTSEGEAFLYVASEGDAPSIAAVDPDRGFGFGDEVVTITGAGFSPAATVRVGGTAATGIDVIDAGTITCRTPARLQGGVVDVLVLNPDGRFAVARDAFTYVTPAPQLVDASTTVLALLGGTRVVVDGASFFAGLSAEVRQGERVVAADVTLVSSTRIVITGPRGLQPGPATLVVTNADGQSSNALAITVLAPVAAPPQIFALSPPSVRVDALVPVRVVGSGFDAGSQLLVDDEVVDVGDVTATSFSFVPPARAVGPVFVRVVNEDGQMATRAFSYEAPSSSLLFAVTPDQVGASIPGDVITVSGLNLSGAVASVQDAAGVTYASTTTSSTSTALVLRLDDPLPEGDGYRVVLAGVDGAQSPTFSAVAPSVSGAVVVAGRPFDGDAFSLLVQGANLNKDRIVAVRFSLVRQDTPDVVVDLAPGVRTSSAVRVDVPAPGLAQGSWRVALVYEFSTAQGPDGFAIEAPGFVQISGDCGNGVVEAGEECDGVSLGGAGCSDVGFFGGALRCTSSCLYDTRLCDRCGDGIVDVDLGEECDGDNLAGVTCDELIAGSTSGTPGCDGRCQRTAGSCATCGNGFREGGEQCDGTDVGTATCATLGYNAGSIGCDLETCVLSGERCSTCGNNRCDLLETTATCPADCVTTCGNGTCDASERCTTCPRDCGGQCAAPFTLSTFDGDGQAGTFSSSLTRPFVVQARAEGNGAPLVGVQVSFTAPSGGAVNPAQVLTDANGRASTLATLPRAPGLATFWATATGPDEQLLQGAPLSFSATATDLAPLAITTIANRPAVAARTSLSSGNVIAVNAALSLRADGGAGVAVRPADGAVFVADTNNHRVVAIDARGTITTVVGDDGGALGFVDNVPGTAARLSRPAGLAFDASNNLYIADSDNARVRRLDAVTGLVTTVAGGGQSNNEGVLATTAKLTSLLGVRFDPAGDLLVVMGGAGGLRRVGADGLITTVVPAGRQCTTNAVAVSSFDDGQLAIDGDGRLLFFAQVNNGGGCPLTSTVHLLRLEHDGTLASLAGGSELVQAGAARGSKLRTPRGLATDAAGNVYFGEASTDTRRVRRINPFGLVATVVGTTGVAATPASTGDGGPANAARLASPVALAFSSTGDLIVVDGGQSNVRLVRSFAQATPPEAVATAFGGGQSAPVLQPLTSPIGVTVVDTAGAPLPGVFVEVVAPGGGAAEPPAGFTDANGVFSAVAYLGRAVGPVAFTLRLIGFDGRAIGAPLVVSATANDLVAGVITTLVNQRGLNGSTLASSAMRSSTSFDAQFADVVVDPDDGSVYVSDAGNHRVLRVAPGGAIAVVAGTGSPGRGGNGPATAIALNGPRGLALDADKRLFIADSNNDVVRMLTPDGDLVVFAGGPIDQADPADGVVATGAALNFPTALAIGPSAPDGSDIPGVTGDLFIVDEQRQRIRRVDIVTPGVPGVIGTIVAGAGCDSSSGPRPSTLPGSDLAFDRSGRLYFTGSVSNLSGCPLPDPNGQYVWRRDLTGELVAIAGGNVSSPSGAAFGTRLEAPQGLAVDRAGNLYVGEANGNRVRRIDALGAMTTVAGDGVAGFSGDNGAAVSARLSRPSGLTFDGAGNLYIVDGNNNRLRIVRGLGRDVPTTATMTIVAGDGQLATIGQLAALPLRVRVVDGDGGPVVNLPVRFSAPDPGDAVTQPVVATTLLGEASTTVRLGRAARSGHVVQATAMTWLDPTEIRGVGGAPVVFSLTAQRPASGTTVAIVNSPGIAGIVPGPGSGESIPATSARLRTNQAGLAMGIDGTLYVADGDNSRVVAVSPEGALTVLAGTGASGFLDNVPAARAQLGLPRGVAIDAEGNVYVSETSTSGGGRVRRIGLDGTMTTVVGGAPDSPGRGDGGPGSGVALSDPRTLAIGPDGALYVVDAGFDNIRRVELTPPFITTSHVAQGGACTSATGLRHSDLTATGLAWDDDERLYFFASTSNGGGCPTPTQNSVVLLRREAGGALSYIAGGPVAAGSTADGLPSTTASLSEASGLVFDAAGALLFVDAGSHRLRRLPGVTAVVAGTTTGASGAVSTVLGDGVAGFGALQLQAAARLNGPRALLRAPGGDLYWTEDGSDSVRLFVP